MKVDTEPGKRISSFFEDENGRLIVEFTGDTGRPEVVSYSDDTNMLHRCIDEI